MHLLISINAVIPRPTRILGREQHITMDAQQEIAIGLQSAPEMAQQHGGLYPDERMQAFVDAVGQKLVQKQYRQGNPL